MLFYVVGGGSGLVLLPVLCPLCGRLPPSEVLYSLMTRGTEEFFSLLVLQLGRRITERAPPVAVDQWRFYNEYTPGETPSKRPSQTLSDPLQNYISQLYKSLNSTFE